MPNPENDTRQLEYETTVFESPLDAPKVQEGRKDLLKNSLDVMLDRWDMGLFETPEGEEAMNYLYGSDPVTGNNTRISMTETLRPLHKLGLAGGLDAWPSVDDMIETGKRIYVTKPDGTTSTYTDLFFNNATVEKLREKEQTKKGPSYGSLMAMHLSLFLSESAKRGELKNIEKAFSGLNPGDRRSTITILPPKGHPIVVDNSPEGAKKDYDLNREKIDIGMQTIKEKADLLGERTRTLFDDEQKKADIDLKLQDLGEEPQVSAKPKEKNLLRRIFCALGGSHSKDYLKRFKTWQKETEKRDTYRKNKEEWTRESEELDKKVKAAQSEIETLKKKKEELAKAIPTAEKLLDASEYTRFLQRAGSAVSQAQRLSGLQEIDREAEEKKRQAEQQKADDALAEEYRKEIYPKLLNAKAVEEIDSSPVAPLSTGMTASLVEVMKKSPGVSGEELLKYKGMDYQLSEALMDREEATAYMTAMEKLAAKAAPPKKGAEPESREQKEARKKAVEKYKEMKKKLGDVYDVRIAESSRLFSKTFGMEPNPENVEKVMKALRFEKQMKERIETVDVPLNKEGKRFELPKIRKSNCGQMTLLLMSGIKTAISEGKIKLAGGEEHIRELSPEEGEKKFREQEKKQSEAFYNQRAEIRGLGL